MKKYIAIITDRDIRFRFKEVIAMLENDYPGEGQATKQKLLRAM